MRRIMLLLILLAGAGLAVGCSENIRSGMLVSSNSVFLVPTSAKTVYIHSRNTSENQQVTLSDLGTKLIAKGYELVKDPQSAQFLIQTRVVYCSKAQSGITPETVLAGGFGSGIGRGMSGGMQDMSGMMAALSSGQIPPNFASMQGGSYSSRGALPTDGIIYFCAADVQIAERTKDRPASSPKDSKPAEPQVHKIRMVAGVEQKKLDVAEATPVLQEKLSTGIAGLF